MVCSSAGFACVSLIYSKCRLVISLTCTLVHLIYLNLNGDCFRHVKNTRCQSNVARRIPNRHVKPRWHIHNNAGCQCDRAKPRHHSLICIYTRVVVYHTVTGVVQTNGTFHSAVSHPDNYMQILERRIMTLSLNNTITTSKHLTKSILPQCQCLNSIIVRNPDGPSRQLGFPSWASR